jgi:thiol-disulfide isomerase/thioredoxin
VRSPARRMAVAALATALTLGVAACSSDSNSIAAQAKAGDSKGYVSGDGAIEHVAAAERKDPLQLSGTTLSGKQWSLKDDRGKVVVLNVWGSWCGPCVSESADLEKVWTKLSKANEPVQFMGINYRESAETARAFLRARHITYPSLADNGGRTLLSLRGKAASTPTTLVLDGKGRIAARVSGPVDAATLSGLVHDVLTESA